MPADILKDLSGQYMKEHYNYPRATEELYDLKRDPNELVNVARHPEYEGIIESLKTDLFNWMKYTNDPILRGKIPKQGSNTFAY